MILALCSRFIFVCVIYITHERVLRPYVHKLQWTYGSVQKSGLLHFAYRSLCNYYHGGITASLYVMLLFSQVCVMYLNLLSWFDSF